jgi:hypothetical protein
MNLLISLLATILGVYAVLLALYFATCGLVVWTSRWTRVPKIQKKKNHARKYNEILDKA